MSRRRTGPEVYVLCRKCGRHVGEVWVFDQGDYAMSPPIGCSEHGTVALPTDPAVARAVAKARRTRGRVVLRVWPAD